MNVTIRNILLFEQLIKSKEFTYNSEKSSGTMVGKGVIAGGMTMDSLEVRKTWETHPILQVLTEEQKTMLLQGMEVIDLPAGSVFIHEGMIDSDLFLLVEGMAKNTFISDEGEEITVLFYHPNDLIGLVSAISHRRTRFSIQTVMDSIVLRMPHVVFEQLLRVNYPFAEKVMRIISQRFDTLYQEIQQEHSYHSTGFDTFPYRKKIGEIMSSPVITAWEGDRLTSLASKMMESRVSSLVILSSGAEIKGIVTREDIIRIVASDPSNLITYHARDVMSTTLLTLPPEAYYYEAIVMMAKHKIQHIPVVTHTHSLEGIITMRNLTEAKGGTILSVVDELESQTTVEGLQNSRQQIYRILDSMVKENATAHEMCSLITELNDRLVRKVIMISEETMRNEGYGNPPVEYCWLTMGSEGRREQTLSTDQDNAIIYQDVEPQGKKQANDYFALLAEKIVTGLEKCGFPRCPGNVMATNPRWRHSVSDWKREIDQWLESVEGEELRNFTIFLDFRPAYGSFALAEEVRTYLISLCKNDRYLLHRLAEDDEEHQVPLGVFGRILTDRNKAHHDEINIKHGGVMHIVNAMRIFALREGVHANSTMERLHALTQRQLFSAEDASNIQEAFNTLMVLRIRQNLKQIQEGKEANNYVCVKALSKREYIRLKKSLSTAKWLQQLVAHRLQVGGRL